MEEEKEGGGEGRPAARVSLKAECYIVARAFIQTNSISKITFKDKSLDYPECQEKMYSLCKLR